MQATKFLASTTLAAALFFSGAAAFAQYGPPPGDGYGQYFHEQPNRPMMGARQGWQAGMAMGRSDRMNRHSFRPTQLDEYKNVPSSPRGYPRQQFKNEYRQAFTKGYSRGYGR